MGEILKLQEVYLAKRKHTAGEWQGRSFSAPSLGTLAFVFRDNRAHEGKV